MVDGRIAEEAYALCARQKWMLRRQQLKDLGFEDHEFRKWQDTGALVPMLPATYRLSVYPESWEQQVQAAVWWGGAGAAACGPTAAALLDMGGYERRGPVHLSVAGRPKLPRNPPFEIVLHPGRVLGTWDFDQREGIIVTRTERTFLDLSPTLELEQLERLIDEALQKGTTRAAWLNGCLKRLRARGRKGTALYARLLEMRKNTLRRTDSPLETKFMKLFDQLGLSVPEPRFWVSRGDTRYRLDFAYVDLKVGIEIDSREFHEGWEQRLSDMARQNDLISWGWRILRFTKGDLDKPDMVAELIRETVARATVRAAA